MHADYYFSIALLEYSHFSIGHIRRIYSLRQEFTYLFSFPSRPSFSIAVLSTCHNLCLVATAISAKLLAFLTHVKPKSVHASAQFVFFTSFCLIKNIFSQKKIQFIFIFMFNRRCNRIINNH